MKNKILQILLTVGLLWCGNHTAIAVELPEDQQLAIITQLASGFLSHNHYRRQPFNNEQSSKVFDEYFELLDPGKVYFLSSDIEEFEPFRYALDDLSEKGDATVAYAVYDRLLQRMEEYQDFAREQLAKGFDFTIDESISLDRKEVSWFSTRDEQYEFWRKRLKNDVLNLRLLKRSLVSENSDDLSEEESELRQIQSLWDQQTPEEKILKRLRDVHNEMSQRDKKEILGFYLTAFAQTYGPHSSYLSPRTEEDFDIEMSLSLCGIGATLTSDDGYTKIVEIVPGGPADLDGRLKAEDRIIAVAQENEAPVDVIDMALSNVVKKIRGPENTKVTLTILPGQGGRSARPESVTITRGKVILKESEASGGIHTVLGNDGVERKIGVIDLTRFYMDFEAAFRGDPNYKSCSRDVRKLLEDFKRQKVDAVIMDMRANGGGSLPEAIMLSGLFIERGPIVQVRNRDRQVRVEKDPDERIVYSGPLVVMTSKMTSSAAEIFSGAMKDYQRAVIVGDSRTYGKGTVLAVTDLANLLKQLHLEFPAGSLKYETDIYYRVNGASTQQLGVRPDIQLPSFTELLEIGEVYNDYHLPWDEIKPAAYRTFDPALPGRIPELQQRSLARRAGDPKYQAFLKRIDFFQELQERKSITLNEETRFAQYEAEKKFNDETQALLSGDTDKDSEKNKQEDPALIETLQIAADLVELTRKDRAQ